MKYIKRFFRTMRLIIMTPVIILCCFLSRLKSKKFDIGMGPLPMINYVYWEQALKKKGYKVQSYVTDVYFITQKFDYIVKNKFLLRYPELLFIRSLFLYKAVYIFFNGGPLMPALLIWRLEPFFYKLAKIKVVVMPYGMDCQIFERTPNKITANNLCQDYPNHYQKKHGRVIKQVDMWSKNADIVVGAMDSIDYLYFWNRIRHCHFAIDTDAIFPVSTIKKNDVFKIIHAPNHMSIKGTYSLEDAIGRLKQEGFVIEYTRVQKMGNEELIKKIQETDLVVDQLVMGWYAMFAMEGMACGKPVVCHMRKDLIEVFEQTGCIEKDEIPLIDATTTSIYDVIKSLIINRDQLEEIGIKSRKFVEKYHSIEAVGDFFDEINKSIGV